MPDLKPGMSAEVTIFTDSAGETCLTVPVQADPGRDGHGQRPQGVRPDADGPEPREVVVGLSNDKMAEIESGLKEGDEVVVNPRVLLGDKEKTGTASRLVPRSGDRGRQGRQGQGQGKARAAGKDGKGAGRPRLRVGDGPPHGRRPEAVQAVASAEQAQQASSAGSPLDLHAGRLRS